ncbi:MAG TPA: hypothetical protein VGM05_12500 [Planctomycetaceae bacterium]|jgi:hypothetical protein
MNSSIPSVTDQHDWSLSIGSWSFGITETPDDFIELAKSFGFIEKKTTVHLGPASFQTSLSAYQVLGLGIVGTVLLAALVAAVITRHRSRQAA